MGMHGKKWVAAALLPLALACAGPQPAWAQPAQAPVAKAAAPVGATVATAATVLRGVSETGRAFDLAQWRGKVVMVYAWDTACAVCLNVMAELRNNLAGWQGQPFELVSINTDARAEDLQSWHRLRAQTQPAHLQWPSLWAGDPALVTSLNVRGQLPAIWVLDKAGVVRFQSRGRMPAEAWDQVAELL